MQMLILMQILTSSVDDAAWTKIQRVLNNEILDKITKKYKTMKIWKLSNNGVRLADSQADTFTKLSSHLNQISDTFC